MELAAVITVSDRCAAGLAEDRSGPLLTAALTGAGYSVVSRVVPDGAASVAGTLREALGAGARLIVSTGGTGVAPRDQTPEGTRTVLTRELPGVAELLRASGLAASPHAALSRGLAGVVDPADGHRGAFVVNLPGSPAAVADGVPVLLALARHVLDQLAGGDH